MARKITIEIIVLLLVVLWVYTGTSKLNDYQVFKIQLSKSPFIYDYAGILSKVLPGFEIATALLLVFKRTRLAGLYVSFFLMCLFTGYIYAMLHFSYSLPCTCGGVISKMSWTQHLFFNLFFTVLALTGIWQTVKTNSYPKLTGVALSTDLKL